MARARAPVSQNAHRIPAINNNLADVQAKLNGILAALRGVGIVAS